MKTASIKNAIEKANKISWKSIVFLNHCAKLTSASPKPTSNVPQVGYKTFVYPSANKYVKRITVLLSPSMGARVSIGIIKTAFADALGMKNSTISTNAYNIITARYGDILVTIL